MCETVMIDYIKRIVKEYTKGRPSGLILDSYGAHITPAIYKLAEKYKIELIVVPCCMTSTLAPLDVGNIYPFFFRYHHYSSSSFFFLPLFLFPFFASLSLAAYFASLVTAMKPGYLIQTHSLVSSFFSRCQWCIKKYLF
jgi:hypothetical protein